MRKNYTKIYEIMEIQDLGVILVLKISTLHLFLGLIIKNPQETVYKNAK